MFILMKVRLRYVKQWNLCNREKNSIDSHLLDFSVVSIDGITQVQNKTNLHLKIVFPDLNPLYLISGAFAKLRKATISFVMSVCLCLFICRMEKLSSCWTDFLSDLIFQDFSKACWENVCLIKIWQEWWVLYVTKSAY